MSAFVYDSTQERRISRVVRDLIRARELVIDLAWKDLRAKYRYAIIGFMWTVLEPLAFTLILTFVFTVLLTDKAALAMPGNQTPFTVMFLCGLIFWQYLSVAVSNATGSLVKDGNLVKKLHFTREVIPLAAILGPIVNLVIGFILLLAVHLILGGGLSWALVWVPVVFAIQFTFTAGLALIFSFGHGLYRDGGNMVGGFFMFGFYASPVFYSLEKGSHTKLLPGWAVKLYMLNPMAELLTAYRQILFEGRFPDWTLLLWPIVISVALVVVGAVLFRRYSPVFSDYL
jgi:ABC-type polysaccharide/polyol phosphate export permease